MIFTRIKSCLIFRAARHPPKRLCTIAGQDVHSADRMCLVRALEHLRFNLVTSWVGSQCKAVEFEMLHSRAP